MEIEKRRDLEYILEEHQSVLLDYPIFYNLYQTIKLLKNPVMEMTKIVYFRENTTRGLLRSKHTAEF